MMAFHEMNLKIKMKGGNNIVEKKNIDIITVYSIYYQLSPQKMENKNIKPCDLQ